jgi:hypothetical protein
MRASLVVGCIAAIEVSSAYAIPTPFDFESTPLGAYPTALTISDGATTLTVTPEGYPNGLVVVGDSSPSSGAATLVGRGVIGSTGAFAQFAPLRFSFSQLISDITFGLGDLGGDEDSPWFIRAYDTGGNLLATSTGAYPAGFSDGLISSFSGLSGASYFLLSTDFTGNRNSIFWDVKSYTLAPTRVPEPAPTVLLISGLLGLVAARRHRIQV